MIALILILLFGIALIAAPMAAAFLGHGLPALPTTIMMGSGIGLVVLSAILLVITRLYVKTKASEAFVRTGMGGFRVIKDGGALVIPVIHQLVRVSLQTIRLCVNRANEVALITKDKLRCDITAEFFVRVQPDDEAITNAARSFGDTAMTIDGIQALVEDKLISALRSVAATKTLEELNSERDSFISQVTANVQQDLAHNGLTLESATISGLDQTDPAKLKENNVFDAQGLRTIASITEQAKTQRNEIERTAELARVQQDVDAKKKSLGLERERAEAEAVQSAAVAAAQAEGSRKEQEATIAAQKAVEVATRNKDKTVQIADQEKQQAVEVAERQRQQAVAEAEAQKAEADAKRASAEALAEKERQNIETVQLVAKADREKQSKVIAAAADAEREYLLEQRKADATAYGVQKDAEARKAAADADAEAVTKKAQADAAAAKLRAEGQQAEAMVPVSVKSAEVDVEGRRVDVLQRELEAREKSGKTAQDFELAKLRITREAEVRIEAAKATATLLGKVEAQVFGTPADVAKMVDRFTHGMGIANTAEGFLAAAGPEVQKSMENVGGLAEQLAAAVAKRLGVSLPQTPSGPSVPASPRTPVKEKATSSDNSAT